MMRAIISVSLSICLMGCVPSESNEALTRAKNFEYQGQSYRLQYQQYMTDSYGIGDPGENTYTSNEVVGVSRGRNDQFEPTQADQKEAEAVAIAYCKKYNFAEILSSAGNGQFIPKSNNDNATWQFIGLCERMIDSAGGLK